MLRLTRSSEQEIATCAAALEAEWKAAEDDPLRYELRNNTPAFSWAAGLILTPSYDCSFLEQGDFLLSLLYHRVGDHKRAFEYLDRNLRRVACPPGRNVYFLGVLSYFRMMGEGLEGADVWESLKDMLGEDLATEIMEDLGDRRQAFRYLRLPECGYCPQCPITDVCCYEGWRRVQTAVRSRLAQVRIDQGPDMKQR